MHVAGVGVGVGEGVGVGVPAGVGPGVGVGVGLGVGVGVGVGVGPGTSGSAGTPAIAPARIGKAASAATGTPSPTIRLTSGGQDAKGTCDLHGDRLADRLGWGEDRRINVGRKSAVDSGRFGCDQAVVFDANGWVYIVPAIGVNGGPVCSNTSRILEFDPPKEDRPKSMAISIKSIRTGRIRANSTNVWPRDRSLCCPALRREGRRISTPRDIGDSSRMFGTLPCSPNCRWCGGAPHRTVGSGGRYH